MTDKSELKYKYSQVITLKWTFEEPELSNIEELKTNIEASVQSNFFYQKESANFVVDFTINLNLAENDFQLFEHCSRHFFGIKNNNKLIKKDKDREYLDLPEELFVTFTSIAYSTTRGLVIEKLGGTRFADVMLPVVDPKKLAPSEKVRVVPFEEE